MKMSYERAMRPVQVALLTDMFSVYDRDGVSLGINERQKPQRTSVKSDGTRIRQRIKLAGCSG